MSTSTAQQIRNALKTELKIIARQVGVRAQNGGIDSSVTVTVKSGVVDIAAVEALAARFEKVDRCQISGDILGGGNTYVSVSVTKEAQAELAAPYVDAIAAAVAELTETPSNAIIEVAPGVGIGGSRYDFRVWANGTAGMHFGDDVTFAGYHVARQVAALATA